MIDWNYDEKTKTLMISGSGEMENYVGKKAPWFKLKISGVIVNNGVINIGDYSFHFSGNLTSAVIPDSVTRIGKCAFEFCSSLSSVIIPDNVEYIGYGAFSGCKKLKEITIPINIKKIEDHVFDGCSSLNSITLINNNGKAHITIFHNEDVPLSKQITMIINKDYSAKMKSEVKYDLLWQLFKLEPDEKLLAYIKNNFTEMICFAIDRNDVETIKSVCKDGKLLTSKNIDNLINRVVKSNNRPEISTILMNYKNEHFGDEADKLSINNEISVSDFEKKNKNKEKSATSGFCGKELQNVKWSYCPDSGLLEISGTGEMDDYYGNNKAPWAKFDVEKVIIGNGVTSIGRRAFFDCSGLTSVTIPDSVTSIGWGAFRGCSSLTSVTIPGSVTSIKKFSFSGCSSLTSVIIPNSVTSIGWGAFLDCSNLTSVTIPNSVTSIGDYAFINCKSLTSVTIPSSVTDIGKDAFDGCDSLRSIIISDRVASSVKYALSKYENLMPIVRRNIETVKRVSVTNISEDLNYRRNIETDKRVSNVTNMSEDLDYNWMCGIKGDNLKWSYDINSGSLEISGTGEMKDYDAGYNKAPWLELNIKKVIIGNGVTSIGKYAFFGCSSLTSVTIPNSVTRIGICAFSGCSSLIYENLKLMFRRNIETDKEVSDVTKMPKYLVHNGLVHNGKCGIVGDILRWSYDINSDSLEISGAGEMKDYDVDNKAPWAKFDIEKVIIEDGVTSIGRFAFYSCSSLTSVTIPDSVTSIGYKAFSGTSWLNAQLKASPFVMAGRIVIDSNPKNCVGDIVIPDGVTSIVFWAFSNCTYLKHVTIPKSVICIGYGAFYHCNSLISVTIPESVITISDNAFEGCENLTIYGKTGSQAQIFATKHGYEFESI